jgi:hypothetical protein
MMSPHRLQLAQLLLLLLLHPATVVLVGGQPPCADNNGGCLPGTTCVVMAGDGDGGGDGTSSLLLQRIGCQYKYQCDALIKPANGYIDCPVTSRQYSLTLVEGDLSKSEESRGSCAIGCNRGFTAMGQPGTRLCTATGWSDTSAVTCVAAAQCRGGSNPCSNGGTCVPGLRGQQRCRCAAGWAGALCSERDSCRTSDGAALLSGACFNGGVCRNIVHGTYGCVCPKAFAGQRCEYPNPCVKPWKDASGFAATAPPCSENGRCRPYSWVRGQPHWELDPSLPPTGGPQKLLATCECEKGWGGQRCEVQAGGVTLTQQALCAARPCFNHGTCFALFGIRMW